LSEFRFYCGNAGKSHRLLLTGTVQPGQLCAESRQLPDFCPSHRSADKAYLASRANQSLALLFCRRYPLTSTILKEHLGFVSQKKVLGLKHDRAKAGCAPWENLGSGIPPPLAGCEGPGYVTRPIFSSLPSKPGAEMTEAG